MVIDYPVIVALMGAGLIGATSGMISCYAVLKEQSLLGDAIAHAALPGICLAFLLTLNKSPIILLTGAMSTGILGMVLITTIIRKTLLKEDTALGIILSIFFGIGTFLLTIIQKIPTSRQAGLDTYLFGNASSMLIQDVYLIGGMSLVIVMVIILCWKEFKCMIFDPGHAQTQGIATIKVELFLTILTVMAIIIGLQTVGVILMSTMMIAPAIAAKQWCRRLSTMMMVSVIVGVGSCLAGVLLSSSYDHLPSGPTIVLVISGVVLVSILFSPNGTIATLIQGYIQRRQIKMDSILSNLYILAQTHKDRRHPHNIQTLMVLNGVPSQKLMIKLRDDGLVDQHGDADHWGLTDRGITRAIQILEGSSS